MRGYVCVCGAPLYFDARSCVACERHVAYDPQADAFVAAPAPLAQLCHNGTEHGVCNWTRDAEHVFCVACQLNRTIPNLGSPQNLRRWHRMEDAKRRLVYTLRALGLPLANGHQQPGHGLLFDFLEDATTGFADGVVTVNIEEADDDAREAQRVALNETYRTLLGHLRHESGHYYLARWRAQTGGSATSLFGDFESDYAAAIAAHYADGPQHDWRAEYISAYASAHPLEDWAETWSHYLHIYDVLETAHAHGLNDSDPAAMTQVERLAQWARVSVVLNELNRSAGVRDAYPFVVTAPVAQKLLAIDTAMQELRAL